MLLSPKTTRAVALLSLLAFPLNHAHAAVEASPLVVHEWGTFTSMQGSNGIALEGLDHEEEPLPDFVHSQMALRPRAALAAAQAPVTPPSPTPLPTPRPPHHPIIHKGLDVDVTGVTQKMETPVIYFHTATPQHVTVKVDFLQGLLTQWYPQSTAVTPVQPEGAGPMDLNTVARSSLTWEGDVVPGKIPSGIPSVAANDPWAFAREVDAAPFVTKTRAGSEAEDYIFYRGLGTFSLPVSIAAHSGGFTALANGAAQDIPAAFAVEVTADTARFVRLGAVAAGKQVDASLTGIALEAKGPVMDKLAAAVTADLVAQGLFADEARAMVRTWARQWFGSPGTRILYLVPRNEIDRVLPLAITPAPSKLVRVLLGRLEFITPATEAAVLEALANRTSADAAVRATAEAKLAGLGRFLEAHVRRALASTQDPAVRASALDVLKTAE